MEPHSRRWQSSGIIVFRVKCKNEGSSLQICYTKCVIMGTVVAQWLRYRATNWIFHWHKILPIALWPWGRLSLWHKWVPGVFPGGKGGRCVRLTTYCHPVPLSRNLGVLTSWNSLGLSRPVMGLIYLFIYLRISGTWSEVLAQRLAAIEILYKTSLHTSQRTYYVLIRRTRLLVLLREVSDVHRDYYKWVLWRMQSCIMLRCVVHIVTSRLWSIKSQQRRW